MYKIIGGDGREYGPISADTLRQWVAEGRVNASSLVQREGSTDWIALGHVPEFSQALSARLSALAPAPGLPSPSVSGPQTNTLGMVGMILGILSLLGTCCCYGLPFNLAAIACSAIALAQIKNDPQRYTGNGQAMTGLVLGIISLIMAGVLLIVGVAASWSDIQKQLHNK
jgi:hypothetical protein